MTKKGFCLIGQLDDATLIQVAGRVADELELRGLPDVSFKQGYKAGFLAALRDGDIGPGQVWGQDRAEGLFTELERRFAA